MMNNKKPDPLIFKKEEMHADTSDQGGAVILSPTRLVLKRFFRNKLAIVGLVILALMIIFSIFGPMISPYGEYEMFYTQNGVEIKNSPDTDLTQPGIALMNKAGVSKTHWLGTDKDGFDILTRLMYGGRVSLMIGIIVVAIELTIGIVLGGISGYFGGWVDMVIMRVVDIFFCIPTMPVLMILGSVLVTMKFPQELKIVFLMLSVAFLGWASITRLVRGQILTLREQEFMTATEAIGLSTKRKIFKHLIPNVMPQLIVFATLDIGNVILLESGLSFLGMGVPYPYASWGKIVNLVNDPIIMTNYLNMWVPAGLLILVTVLAFNFVGDGLRDAFDPKMKR